MKAPAKSPIRLVLYVAQTAPNSIRAIANLRTHLTNQGQQADLELIDVFQNAERAARDHVIVTPTLVRLWPKPEVRIVGDLRDADVLRDVLGT